MKQVEWFNRKFIFDNNQNTFPSILERLMGTPIRLEEKTKELSEETVTCSFQNTWTIKENIGHLIDLELLWQGRMNDIINGESELRPADLLNKQTDLANHNATPLEVLLSKFKKIRQETIAMLLSISEEMVFKSALHPRLNKPMRTMDLFLFVAEHDDHHLARMTELIILSTKKTTDKLSKQKISSDEYRVKFDFEIYFTNGGSLKGEKFRLDIHNDTISDDDLANYIVKDLRLLMVGETKITNKEIIKEAHKRT